ncbi:MAG: hypothetical protein K0S41_4360, partial [Anaerocolumna sp.]|nr:hypothetical protein [Anaerocolumna sp.]
DGLSVGDSFDVFTGSYSQSGDSVYVKQVKYLEYIGTTGSYIEHKIDVYTTIKMNQ